MQFAAVPSGAIIIQLCVVALQRRLDIGRRSEQGYTSSCVNTQQDIPAAVPTHTVLSWYGSKQQQ
jgi:hypothetical protein